MLSSGYYESIESLSIESTNRYVVEMYRIMLINTAVGHGQGIKRMLSSPFEILLNAHAQSRWTF